MIFKHLLPRARAWSLTIRKRLREFFEGLTVALIDDIREFLDYVWRDVDPAETREPGAWEAQFGLPDTALSESARRDRLDAAWKASGGQSPSYIQETLRANGFDVYVHEWWVPGTEPAVGVQGDATPRNASTTLVDPAYTLVNIVLTSEPDYIVLAGETGMEAGEQLAEAGNYLNFTEKRKDYGLPGSDGWPFMLYIGGQAFGTFASIGADRRDEFEALCLRICPCQLWLGMIVQYI